MLVSVLSTFLTSMDLLFSISGCRSEIFLDIIFFFLTQHFSIVLHVREITGTVDHIHNVKEFVIVIHSLRNNSHSLLNRRN